MLLACSSILQIVKRTEIWPYNTTTFPFAWQWHQLDRMQIICTSLQPNNLATQFLANVVRYMLSPVRLSVCLSVVCRL